MVRLVATVGSTVALLAMAFLMEPLFPLGDWRWGVLAAVGLIPVAVLYRDSVRAPIAAVQRLVRTIRMAQQYESDPRTPPQDRIVPATSAPAPPPDEPLVILCRRYALPAYQALGEVVNDVTAQCFACGGWRGLAARLLRDLVVTPNAEKVENVKAGLDGTRSVPLVGDFREFVFAYDALMGLAYQFGRDDIGLDQRKLERWGELDRRFETQLADLGAGIDRGELAVLTYPPSEARELLHGLRVSS